MDVCPSTRYLAFPAATKSQAPPSSQPSLTCWRGTRELVEVAERVDLPLDDEGSEEAQVVQVEEEDGKEAQDCEQGPLPLSIHTSTSHHLPP